MTEAVYGKSLREIVAFTSPELGIFIRGLLDSFLPVTTQLETAIRSSNLETIDHAVFVITHLPVSDLAPQMIDLINIYPEKGWQWLSMLGNMDHEAISPFLLKTLQFSTDMTWRIASVVALRDGHRPESIGPLLAAAQDTSEWTNLRGMAIEALAYQGDKSLLPYILPFLQDAEWLLRWDALYTVGRLGDASFTSYIEPLLNDSTPKLAEEARHILDTWARKGT